MKLEALEGDITQADTDAIANAANESLLGGGGVDGAIHRAAGPALLAHCRALGGCPTGQARITPGFNLKARHIIHCVGPVWRGGHDDEDLLLEGCYRGAMALMAEHGLASISFPAISTGVYRFPRDRAAAIAVRTVRDAAGPGVELVRFVAFDAETLETYQRLLSA